MLMILDCDGVVVDSMHLHTEVEAEAYQAIGINITPQELVRRFSGVSDAEVNRILEKETGIAIPSDIALQIDRRKEEVFTQRLKPVGGIRDALMEIRNIPRCIASGTGVDALDHMLEVVKLHDLFAPHIYSSEMVERGKPFPDLLLHGAGKMGHPPTSCLVIEDGIAGVQAGKAAGMRVFGFVGGSHCDEGHGDRLKSAGAELVFSEMRELPSLIEQFCKI
jgi:HAD superfamily hydrolase (TIGR01509 family)